MSGHPGSDPDAGREPIERDVEEAYEESGHPPGRANRRAEDAVENAGRSGQLDESDESDESDEEGEKGTGLLE